MGDEDCDGQLDASSYSLVNTSSCSGLDGTSLTGQSAQLGALADNGGPTRTYALPASSPAVDLIPTSTTDPNRFCSGNASDQIVDQRDFLRGSGAGSGGAACDAGAFEDGSQVLPVELVAFSATPDGDAIRLAWTTASETNNSGFDVQLDAGAGWRSAAWVDGAGTTLETARYTHRLAGLEPGIYRVRLRQVDLDGAFAYSSVVETAIDASGPVLFGPQPNPSAESAVVRFLLPRGGAATVSAYDALGRRAAILFDGMTGAGALHQAELGANLAPGIYAIVLETNGERLTQTWVRVR